MYFLKGNINAVPNIRKFDVVGIFNSGFQELDETYFIGDIKHVQRLNKWKKDQIGNFEVFIENYNALNTKGIEVYQNTPSNLNTQTVAQKYASIFEWIGIF